MEEEEVLTKEEDWTVSLLMYGCVVPIADTNLQVSLSVLDCRFQVPGGYKDSLTKNTPLGRAVSDACSELEQLGAMVRRLLGRHVIRRLALLIQNAL